MKPPPRPSLVEAVAGGVLTLLLVVVVCASLLVSCGCRHGQPAGPALAGATALRPPPPAADTAAPPARATESLQRAQSATVCVSTEVRAAREVLAADVAPTLPGPAAAVDQHLDAVERCAAALPPALAAAAKATPPAPPADMGDRRVWRWGAWLGALAMLGGMAAAAVMLVWGLGSPRLGAGVAAGGAALAITSYLWQTWATITTVAAGLLVVLALLYAGWINRRALLAALRMDSAIKAGYPRETAKAAALAEQSPAIAAAIRRAKDVLPILPPLPPATPTTPARDTR